MSTKEETFQHPSYAMIGFSRVSGDPGPLFGSQVTSHHTFMRLRIHHAERRHHLNSDWFSAVHADGGGQSLIVEVDLSAVQFAELLTCPNVGDGVPCTLRYLEGAPPIEAAPEVVSPMEEVRDDFRRSAEHLASLVRVHHEEMKKLLPKLTKKEREEAERRMSMIEQEIRSNMPFVEQCFREVTEKSIAAAKAEVDAFVTHAVMAAGTQALRDRATQTALPRAEEDVGAPLIGEGKDESAAEAGEVT